MKSFREWLNESKNKEINEGQLDKSSIMSGSSPSRDINFNARKGEIGIWLNGGSKYVIKIQPETINNMYEKFNSDESDKYMAKYVDKLAVDVAEFIAKEVSKWEKDFKAK